MLASTVALTLHALLSLQAPPVPPPAAANESTILWFRSADTASIDARALLDAVAVYTRDLGLAVRAAAESTPVPADAASARAAASALRAQGARLGFWCEMRAGTENAVLTVVAPDGHLELHTVERTGAHEAELYRAIGLKLRSVLVGNATPEPAPPRPSPTAPPPATETETGVRAAPTAPSLSGRLFLSAGYRFSAPFDAGPLRHALAIDGAMTLGRLFELDVGTALAARVEQRVGSDAISVFDWPITAGARVVRRGARFTVGGGVFGVLHLLWASATRDAMQPSSFTVAGGAGAELLARLRLAGALAGELRLYAEVPMPATHYFVGDVDALAVGPRAGVGLGLAFPAP